MSLPEATPEANPAPEIPQQEEAHMLDVHPPHAPVHGVRDFLLHIFTITIGLLIALGLEAAVEYAHHRHVVHAARETLREEIKENQQILVTDRRFLDSNSGTLRRDIALLEQLKQNPKSVDTAAIGFPWRWNSPGVTAWDTARNTGALALMSYDDAHAYSLVYGQQSFVNTQATLYIDHHHTALIPLSIHPDLATLSPAQIDEVIHGLAATLVDIEYLEELMKGLELNYGQLLREQEAAAK